MTTSELPATTAPARRDVLTLAWIVTLLVSVLPDVLTGELAGGTPGWLLWAKLGLLVALVVAATWWPAARALRGYCAILAVVYLAEELRRRVELTGLWQGWFGGADAPFTREMMGVQLMRLLVTLIVIAGLLALGYRRRAFFLTPGDLDAPAAPERWLGIRAGTPWTRLGRTLALILSLGTLTFLVLAGRPSLDVVARALPLLPAILLFAVMNAFSEEVTYRSSLLAPLVSVVGRPQALLLTAFFFGIGHYYGVPYGVVGVLMAGFLGWLLGKAMVETRGLFWPWLLHMLQDVFIFAFLGIGSVVAGG